MPRSTKCPKNGVIGELPAPTRPVGEFTENPTLQAVRGSLPDCPLFGHAKESVIQYFKRLAGNRIKSGPIITRMSSQEVSQKGSFTGPKVFRFCNRRI